ncbi:MAG: hypothetical protein DWI58_11050 [Chloroflexi bacterium]|nr:MAG: hypothetical protein DWI58_11050 [Chloroflexota bacterium]
MTARATQVVEEIRLALRAPIVPSPIARLAEVAPGYLEVVWPRVASSVDAAGFLGSGLYLADMALAEVEASYEPVLTPEALREAGVVESDVASILEVIDVFHYGQPQLLLLLAALAEAFGRDRVGGYGKADPRAVTERERTHLALDLRRASAEAGLLPEVAAAMNLDTPPDLYRAVAVWPRYLEVAWEELQHLAAYPPFRRRGRGLYFYARSGARFLAEPLEADPAALRTAGLDEATIEAARAAVDDALPAVAMMIMHAEAMRLGLGVRTREVVQA